MFRNRADAGRQLGRRLSQYAGRADVLVLALPRGGVPERFHSVGGRYDDFAQTSDEETAEIAGRAKFEV